jgi:hypothetical protein
MNLNHIKFLLAEETILQYLNHVSKEAERSVTSEDIIPDDLMT